MNSEDFLYLDRLQPNYLENICDAAANIVYSIGSDGKNSVERKKAIVFLHNWCSQTPPGHVSFDKNAITCVIDQLRSNREKCRISELIQITNPIIEELQKTNDEESLSDELKAFRIQIATINGKNQRNWEMMKRRDYMDLNETFVPDHTTKRNKLEDVLKTYEKMPVLNESANLDKTKCKTDSNEYRNHQLAASFAILNLNLGENGNFLMKEILTTFSSYECLNEKEVDFIEYLYNNFCELNFPIEVLYYIIKHFPFIYEKPIIKMCTKMICGEEEEIANFQLFVRRLLQRSSDSGILSNVKSILYELYAYSGYNQLFHRLIDAINQM